jgi:hypothetical protein
MHLSCHPTRPFQRIVGEVTGVVDPPQRRVPKPSSNPFVLSKVNHIMAFHVEQLPATLFGGGPHLRGLHAGNSHTTCPHLQGVTGKDDRPAFRPDPSRSGVRENAPPLCRLLPGGVRGSATRSNGGCGMCMKGGFDSPSTTRKNPLSPIKRNLRQNRNHSLKKLRRAWNCSMPIRALG